VYDGSGGVPIKADVGIKADKVVKIGNLKGAKATTIVDATGMAVAPGFINMLSWSTESLIVDPRSLGELKQGRHDPDIRRGQLDGPAQRPDEKADEGRSGRSEIRDRMDDACRII
jgi:N-acyl-D-amino-acid deacylase